MAEDHIRYDILAQEALRGVVRKVLGEVARTGLPGEHHFFISFATRAPGVRLSQRLLEQYDKEMTIVLQNQFWDLKVGDAAFEVGLSFDGQPEMLVLPCAAIKGFSAPSVQFGLRFDPVTAPAAVDAPPLPDPQPPEAPPEPARDPAPGEKIISLDSFRKKP
jgi:hypothetical protein